MPHGYSKDHRPDLKQFVISLVMSNNSDNLPVFYRRRKNRWRTRYGIPPIMSFTTRKTH